ncbi:hypothetical protein BD779DRAFT_1515400 [Infundibulicybe gibba]|nr:hypothetical protein BD779DRAFT_1515400 [Infundibulicybe gibba]
MTTLRDDIISLPESTEGPSLNPANDESSLTIGGAASTPATSCVPVVEAMPSYKSIYTTPPAVTTPYSPEAALDDLPGVAYALELFMASHMVESEEYDLLAGIGHTKQGNVIASQHRKKAAFFTSRLAGYVVSSLNTTGVGFIKSMTPVERHAELVYAESLFEKALLGIVYSGDWLAFIKEALNMRTTIGVYRQLGQFIDAMDAEAVARGEGPEDKSIDAHFRSGVYLGVGMCNIILSLMPGKLMTLVELFGYKGDRHAGLANLLKAGGWSTERDEPEISTAEEGVRRTICDMALLIFHLKILDWNLKRFPNGVFFLFGAGRLSLCRSQPQKAIEYYTKAMESQTQYRNLHHISYWEIAIANLALWELPASLACWKELEAEATWSKSIYSYGMAVCLLEIGGSDKAVKEAAALLAKVPGLRQKIAGKSIPLEARKFQSQGNRLALPALELAYLFLGIAHAPTDVIVTKMLPEVRLLLDKLNSKENSKNPKKYESGHGYWDDLCLAKSSKGFVVGQDPDAIHEPAKVVSISKEDASKGAIEAFEAVFEHGPKIELDHHLVYHAHYELGRLLACLGDVTGAENHFNLVISGKHLEVGASGRKGKYSMENALHMRTHAALDALHQKRL